VCCDAPRGGRRAPGGRLVVCQVRVSGFTLRVVGTRTVWSSFFFRTRSCIRRSRHCTTNLRFSDGGRHELVATGCMLAYGGIYEH